MKAKFITADQLHAYIDIGPFMRPPSVIKRPVFQPAPVYYPTSAGEVPRVSERIRERCYLLSGFEAGTGWGQRVPVYQETPEQT